MADKISMTAIRAQYPMYSNLSDEQLADALHQKFYAQVPREEFMGRINMDTPAAKAKAQEALRQQFDPTKDMSTFEKLAASAGAGFSDVGLAAQQRWADWTGNKKRAAELEQEAADKRAMDERLTSSVTGGNLARLVGQAGAASPLMLIPGGQGVLAQTALGAAGGAAAGYLQPTVKGESAEANALIGGVFGGAVPLGISGARRLYGAVTGRNAAAQAGREIAQAVANQGDEAGGFIARRHAAAQAPQRLANELETTLGANPNAAAQAQALQGVGPTQGGIPLSTAARTQDMRLARLEQASRIRNPELWTDFDRSHAQAIADSIRAATAGGAEEQALRTARNAAYRDAWANVEQQIDPTIFAQGSQGLRRSVEGLRTSADAVDPNVSRMLNQITDAMDTAGQEWSPAHVRELRSLFRTKALPGQPPSAFQAAPKSSQAVRDTITGLDALLDVSSGGAWSPVNQAYREASQQVRAAEAANMIRNTFFDPQGMAATTARFGQDIPTVTETGLRRAIARTVDPWNNQSRLAPEANQTLQNTLEAIRSQNIIQQMKRSATAGGGSDTASNLTALAQEGLGQELLNVTPRPVRAAINVGRRLARGRVDTATAQALQNPELLAQTLRAAGQQQRGLGAGIVAHSKDVSPIIADWITAPPETFQQGAGY